MEVFSPSDDTNNRINQSKCPAEDPADIIEYFANLIEEDNKCMFYRAYIDLGHESHKITILVHSIHRTNYVNLICSVGDDFFLRNSTIELAILLMDELSRTATDLITSNDLVAITCVMIAAKYEECEYNIPTLNEITNYFQLNSDEVIYLKKMEFGVLKFLKWNITLPLYTTFIEYFNSKGFIFTDDTSYKQPISQLNIILLNDCREKCMLLYRYDYELQLYQKSKIAAATIIVCRMYAKFDMMWRYELYQLTGYGYDSLYSIFTLIYTKLFNNLMIACK